MMAARASKMSQMDAPRKAIKELGKDVSPMKIQDYSQEKFGVEMTTAQVSNYKNLILRGKIRKEGCNCSGESFDG